MWKKPIIRVLVLTICIILVLTLCLPQYGINKSRRVIQSPSWAQNTKERALYNYIEHDNYAGFGNVDIDRESKPDLLTTYYFIGILHILGETLPPDKNKEISQYWAHILENEKFSKDRYVNINSEEEQIYFIVSLLDNNDLNKIKHTAYSRITKLYFKDREAITDFQDAKSYDLQKLLACYNTFKILGMFPTEAVNQDKIKLIELVTTIKFPDVPVSSKIISKNLNLLRCYAEIVEYPSKIPASIYNKLREWFEKNVRYLSNQRQFIIGNAMFIGTVMDIGNFLGINTEINNSFLLGILNSFHNGGWNLTNSNDVPSPFVTYYMVNLFKNTGNMQKIPRSNIIKMINFYSREGGFALPYNIKVDPEETYYGLIIDKYIPLGINKRKILNYVEDNTKKNLEVIKNIVVQMKDESYSSGMNFVKAKFLESYSYLRPLYYDSLILQLLNDNQLSGEIASVAYNLVKSRILRIVPLDSTNVFDKQILLYEIYYLSYLSKDSYMVINNSQRLNEVYSIAIDPESIFYIAYITNTSHFNGVKIKVADFTKLLSKNHSLLFGGYKVKQKSLMPDLFSTYYGVKTLMLCNSKINKSKIEKFLLTTVVSKGGFNLYPFSRYHFERVFYLKLTAEGLWLFYTVNR